MDRRKSRDDGLKHKSDSYNIGAGPAGSRKSHPLYAGEIRDKKKAILAFIKNNPGKTAQEVANQFKTSSSYVYNVKSEAGLTRSYRRAKPKKNLTSCGQGVATNLTSYRRVSHGLSLFRLLEVLPVDWVRELDPVVFVLVNSYARRRQCGFKSRGDPCSAQVYDTTGRLVVFPHRSDWRSWLIDRFVEAGWDRDRSEFVVGSLQRSWMVREFVIPWPKEYMPPRGFRARPAAFLTLKHNGSDPDHIEAELRVDQLAKDLGIPDILGQIDVLTKGQATLYQEFRRWTAFATLLAQRLTGALDRLGVKVDAEKEGSVAEHPTKGVQGRPVYERFFPLKWRETSPALSRDSNPGYHDCVEGLTKPVPECMAKECHFKCRLLWRN